MAAPLTLTNSIKLGFSKKFTSTLSFAIHRHYAVGKPGSPNRLEEVDLEDEEFRMLVIPGFNSPPKEKRKERRNTRKPDPPPRYKSMRVDQDWTNVWPAAETFKWSVVPFPVRQGMIEGTENDGIPPGKYANAELMKIPNFLHATPAHIKKHCAVLKQYCTEWPKELSSDEAIREHFPVEVITKEYMVDAPTPRDSRGRGVTLKVNLSSLNLDEHAHDKMLRLVGDRYDEKTDTLTISSERCPVKKQNYDFCMYVLTALYHESKTVEDWESEKQVSDMEKFVWDIMPSKQSTVNTVMKMTQTKDADNLPEDLHDLTENVSEDSIVTLNSVQNYKKAVEDLHNVGEDQNNIKLYKQATLKLLGLKHQEDLDTL